MFYSHFTTFCDPAPPSTAPWRWNCVGLCRPWRVPMSTMERSRVRTSTGRPLRPHSPRHTSRRSVSRPEPVTDLGRRKGDVRWSRTSADGTGTCATKRSTGSSAAAPDAADAIYTYIYIHTYINTLYIYIYIYIYICLSAGTAEGISRPDGVSPSLSLSLSQKAGWLPRPVSTLARGLISWLSR